MNYLVAIPEMSDDFYVQKYVGNYLDYFFRNTLKPNFQTIVGVFISAITAGLMVYFVCTAISAGFKYRQETGYTIPWRKLILQFAGMVIGTTASLWMWGLIGW